MIAGKTLGELPPLSPATAPTTLSPGAARPRGSWVLGRGWVVGRQLPKGLLQVPSLKSGNTERQHFVFLNVNESGQYSLDVS